MTTIVIGPLTIDPDSIPELVALRGVPQPLEHHPEGDVWTHVMMVVEQAKRLTDDPWVHLAALLHDLGKGVTPREEWPHHYEHEESGVPLVRKVAWDLATTNIDWMWTEVAELCERVCQHHLRAHRILDAGRPAVRRLLRDLRAVEEPEQFERFVLACEADARGRFGLEDRDYFQAAYLRAARDEYAVELRREAIRPRIRAAVYEGLDPRTMTPEEHRGLREKIGALVEAVDAIQQRTKA